MSYLRMSRGRERLRLLAVGVFWGVSTFADEQVQPPFTFVPGYISEERVIKPDQAASLSRKNPQLGLIKVKEVSAEVAIALGDNEPPGETFLWLPEVTTIDKASAGALSRRRGQIRLDSVRSLTPEVAASLGENVGARIALPALTQVSLDLASTLATWKRNAILVGVKEFEPGVARALAEFSGELYFPDLQSVSGETSLAFSVHRSYIDFGGARLRPGQALNLLHHDGPIGFTGVSRLMPGVGDILARHRNSVRVRLEEFDSLPLLRKVLSGPFAAEGVVNLRVMSPEVARAYVTSGAKHPLPRLRSLCTKAAEELAVGSGVLMLPGVSELTPELATALTNRRQQVVLAGVKSLAGANSEAIANALVGTAAPVDLRGLEEVSSKALEILERKATIALPLDGKMKVIP